MEGLEGLEILGGPGKSVYFNTQLHDPHFYQNCGTFQYNISCFVLMSADVIVKSNKTLKEMRKMNRLYLTTL